MRRWPALLLLALVACSSERTPEAERREAGAAGAESTATRAARPGGACGSVTAAEASEALDQPSRYRRDAAGGSEHCVLVPASGDAFHGVSVDYRMWRGSTKAYDFLAAQKQSQPVRGLGDRALWLAAGRTRGNLAVVKGRDVLSLTITDFRAASDLRARARAVARLVLDRR